jgi:hypothetical protein
LKGVLGARSPVRAASKQASNDARTQHDLQISFTGDAVAADGFPILLDRCAAERTLRYIQMFGRYVSNYC